MNIGSKQGVGFSRIDPGKIEAVYLKNGSLTNMAVNGSVAPVSFKYAPPVGKSIIVSTVNVFLKSSTNYDDEKFADRTALANGVLVKANGEEITTLKSNRDITSLMPGWKPAVGDEGKSITGDWSLNIGGDAQGIEVRPGNDFEFIIQDDLSGISLTFMALIKGWLIG